MSFCRLNELQAKDVAKLANEHAKNTLESFLYEFKDKLYSDAVELLSTEEERTKISEKFSLTSDWVDEEGFDSTAEVSTSDDASFQYLLMSLLGSSWKVHF